jgi:hypothetical protein
VYRKGRQAASETHALLAEEAQAIRRTHRFSASGNAELGEDRCEVMIDGARGAIQTLPDLLVPQALSE